MWSRMSVWMGLVLGERGLVRGWYAFIYSEGAAHLTEHVVLGYAWEC